MSLVEGAQFFEDTTPRIFFLIGVLHARNRMATEAKRN